MRKTEVLGQKPTFFFLLPTEKLMFLYINKNGVGKWAFGHRLYLGLKMLKNGQN